MNILEAIRTLEIVSNNITETEVKKAYRDLIKIWHPDKHENKRTKEIAVDKSSNINLALETLTEYIEINGEINLSTLSTKDNLSYDVQHVYDHEHFAPGFPDETVFEHFLKSSHILSAGYNFITHKLYIKFKDNSVYEYINVPSKMFEELLNAEAPGRYANKYIYRSLTYRLCREPNKPFNGIQYLNSFTE